MQTAKLENGLQIFVVERHDLPKIALTLATRAGGLADPTGKEGVANLVMRTIDRGTKTRTAIQIEDELGDLEQRSLAARGARRRSLAWMS